MVLDSSARSAAPGSATVLPVRGTVEGFYGRPWTHGDRLAHVEFSVARGLNTYVYAPKDDRYHRASWREPYPAPELAHIAELAATAQRLGVRFVYALAPALSMSFAAEADHAALAAKAQQLWDAGVREFALFFDDVPYDLAVPADVARFGPGQAGSGAAHGDACARFVDRFLAPRGVRGPLLVCPTDYAGTADSPYREAFAASAPHDVVITWTGRDVVVGSITRDEVDAAAASYRRPVLLWDNYPVNDFDFSRVFLGPLVGRPADLAGSALVGVLANPMPEAIASRLAISTVAEWAADPAGYDPAQAGRRALDAVAGPGANALRPLVRACSAWPPGADRDPELCRAARGALAGEPGALDVLTTRLEELRAGCRAAREPSALVAQLRPWLDAGAAVAEAGLLAARLLRPQPTQDLTALRERARATLDRSEQHYADVLRAIVSPFVRAVLDRTAPSAPVVGDKRPVAIVVAGASRSGGDEALVALLGEGGFAAHLVHRPAPTDLARASLVVVADADGASVARDVPVPVIAWRGLVELGLASRTELHTGSHRVRVVAPGDRLAAGLTGVVTVYRGPGRITVADPEPDAEVVASAPSDGRPLLFRYAAGDRLVGGTRAPALRIALFLGPDGLAPWLIADAGRSIVRAAVAAALRPRASLV